MKHLTVKPTDYWAGTNDEVKPMTPSYFPSIFLLLIYPFKYWKENSYKMLRCTDQIPLAARLIINKIKIIEINWRSKKTKR